MGAALETFFEAIWPFMQRRAGVGETVAALGPSPSGNARLALYPELVRRQQRGVLDRFFASVRAACEAYQPKLWDRLVEAFILETAPRHWEPNRYAEPFPAFLEARRKLEPSLPPVLLELADFAWIRFSAMIAEHSGGSDPELGRAVFVRHYTHEIPKYALAVEDGSSKLDGSPERSPCTVLVCRSRHTARLEIVRPSLVALIALRRREMPNGPLQLPDRLTEVEVDREDAALVELGVLAPC